MSFSSHLSCHFSPKDFSLPPTGSFIFSIHLLSALYSLGDSTFQGVQFSSVTRLCPTLCDPMVSSTPGLPGHHQVLELTQIHVHQVGDVIHHLILCCPLLFLPSILASFRVFSNESSYSQQVAKVLEFQLQHQSFQ